MGMTADTDSADVGRRAEEVAGWYFRLNGFFLLPAFVVHKDWCDELPKTEADLLAVRLKHSAEYVKGRRLKDDPAVYSMARVDGIVRNLAIMVEVKAGKCRINGPWSCREKGNVQYALRRVGCIAANQIDSAAESIYRDLRWVGKDWIVQYVCVGKKKSPGLNKGRNLVQVTFEDIGRFLHTRFSKFPEKIPLLPGVLQWPGFGSAYAYWSDSARHRKCFTAKESVQAVQRYIDTGDL